MLSEGGFEWDNVRQFLSFLSLTFVISVPILQRGTVRLQTISGHLYSDLFQSSSPKFSVLSNLAFFREDCYVHMHDLPIAHFIFCCYPSSDDYWCVCVLDIIWYYMYVAFCKPVGKYLLVRHLQFAPWLNHSVTDVAGSRPWNPLLQMQWCM